VKSTVVIQVEGILRKPVGGQVLDSGRRLYHGLAGTYNLVLVTEDTNREQSKTWMALEGFDKHAHVEYCAVGFSPAYWHVVVMALKLSYGYIVEYVVQPDPVTAEFLIRRGYSTLLVTNAAYALPEWRPDAPTGVKPWEELVAEIHGQRALRAADKRMEDGLK
jgi:hypothetical protein